jgi:hypothetical protein
VPCPIGFVNPGFCAPMRKIRVSADPG